MEFEDLNGVPCKLQKSSLATDDAIWLGTTELGLKRSARDYTGWHDVNVKDLFPGQDVVWNGAMHLTREQVAELLPALRKFVETGELP